MTLFNLGDFTLHSGEKSNFKIDCDALSDQDLEALAVIGAKMVGEFGEVIGVPTGGERFALALKKYAVESPILLIVDDVMTTGESISEYYIKNKSRYGIKGLVIFDRSGYLKPYWIYPIFKMIAP